MQLLYEGVDVHSYGDDESYLEFVRGSGVEGLRRLSEILKGMGDEEDQGIACFAVSLVIRSRLPGRVGVILDVLGLPFHDRAGRDDVLTTAFDEIAGDPEFVRDEEFVSEARRVETNSPYVKELISRFLDIAAKSRDLPLP